MVNENILKFVQHASIAVLVLGVLVWVLHLNNERDRIERERMSGVIMSVLEEDRQRCREITQALAELTNRIERFEGMQDKKLNPSIKLR